MLSQISLGNFRAFKSESIPLSKLNIFVGPNNSGKSSIISAINLIAQNLKNGTKEYTLALNGPYVDLGTFYDTVHGHTAKAVMGIGFVVNGYKYDFRYRYRPQKREIELTRADIEFKDCIFRYSNNEGVISQYVSIQSLGIDRYAIREKTKLYGFVLNPLSMSFFSKKMLDELGADQFRSLRLFLMRSVSNLENSMSRFDSIGAFRTAPQRAYHYTGEAPVSVGRDGEKSAQMLASSSSSRARSKTSVMRSVSDWFRDSGIAKNVKIKSLTNRHFEITVEDRAGYTSNITDAGFGCSQVLPVLAAGFNLVVSKRDSSPAILVVQEPEIHLHPSAAAHMGSYFSDLVKSNVQCFVETHSENIVLRVAQHVASGELSPEDVNIYWVSANTGEHVVTKMHLREDGTFVESWPEGFFPTRSKETIDLARAAMKKSKSGDKLSSSK